MSMHNYMEDIVGETLDILISERDDLCKCDKCKLDIAAMALNKLSPKYVVTSKGRVYTKLNELEFQHRADILKEVTKAIEFVRVNLKH